MNPIIFCDFDGTITTDETLVKLAMVLAPDTAARLLPALLKGEVTVKAGIRSLLLLGGPV